MHAYLDPGSGSMLLGLVASGMAGIVVVFKTFGHRIMSFLTFWKKDEPAVAEPTAPAAAAEDADPAVAETTAAAAEDADPASTTAS